MLYVCRHTCSNGGCPVAAHGTAGGPSIYAKRSQWKRHGRNPHTSCKDPSCPGYIAAAEQILKSNEDGLLDTTYLFLTDSHTLDDYISKHPALEDRVRELLRHPAARAVYPASRYLAPSLSPLPLAPSGRPGPMTIVVVPEPICSRFSQASQSAFTLSTAIVNLHAEDLKFLQEVIPTGICADVPDGVYADSEKADGTTTVALWEWAYILLLLRNKLGTSRVNFVPLSYSRFIETVMDPPAHVLTFRGLQKANMIFGGPSLNENWLDPMYEIGDAEHLQKYLAAAHILLRTTTMFPNPHDSLIGGNKVILHANLDYIALAHNPPHFRPRTRPGRLFVPGERDVVHKRGYSARSDGVIMYDHPDAPTISGVSGEAARVQDADKSGIWSKLGTCNLPPTDDRLVSSSWVSQVTIPSLLDYHFGELRVFVVGGKVTRTIQTAPWNNALYSEVIRSGVPTRAAADRRDLFTKNNATWSKFFTADLTADDLGSGADELHAFVYDVFHSLVAKERAMRRVPLVDIELFCRIDVGIVECSNSYEYFVLEVERGLSTCMWSWLDWLGSCTDMVKVAQLLPELARRRA
ncbi:hypothetical protein EV122DRAFT_225386 [Schizophyllum commune]